MLYRGVDPLTAPTDDISFLMDTLGPATPAAEQLMASIWAFLYPHAATVALP